MKGMYTWLGKHVHAPYGIFMLALLTVIEGFFIIPVSTVLAFFCLENRKKAFIYATVTTLASGIGALIGYYLGVLLWQWAGGTLINKLIGAETFTHLVEQFKNHQAWAITGIALTPFPFKALTLTAGFCKLPLAPFIAFTLLGRGIRFYLIATGIYIWGDKIQYYLDKYFYYFAALGISMLIGSWWFLH